MIYLIAVVLAVLVAVLWYGVRTHKTVQDLKAKLEAAAEKGAADITGAMKK